MRKLKFLMAALGVCFMLTFTLHVSAEQAYVYDMADLLTVSEELELAKMAAEFQKSWNMNCLVVTTDDALELSSGDFAAEFYDTCFPYEVDDDGCLFLIDMDNREIYLSTCGKMTSYLMDEQVESILDDAFSYVADGDYYGTFQAFFEGTEQYLSQVVSEEAVTISEVYMYDIADLLTTEEELELQHMAEEFEKRWNMNFVAVTIDDALGMSSKEFADGYYDACYPESSDDDGCLYLIDMDNQEIYISTSGKAMQYLTEDRIEAVLDEAYNYVTEGDYFGTFTAFFEKTQYFLQQGILQNEQDNVIKETAQPEQDNVLQPLQPQKGLTEGEAIIALLIAGIAAILMRRKIVGDYQLKYVDRDYENEAYGNARLTVYDKEDKLVNSFVTSRRIEPRYVERDIHHSRPVYRDDYEEPTPVRRPSGRNHGGSGRSFGSSTRSHGGGGRSFSSGSRSGGGGRSFGSSGGRSSSRSSGGGRSRGGGGRKF